MQRNTPHCDCRRLISVVRCKATPGSVRSTFLLLIASIVSLAFVASPQALAQLPTARLMAVFPAGGQQGTSVDLNITSSTDLDGANRLWFDHPGIQATQKTQMVEGQEQPQPVANAFTVSIASDVPPGTYEMRVEGTYGVSNPRLFVVGDRPETLEAEPNNTLTEAGSPEVGTVVNGQIGAANDIDCFRFKALAGQRIIIAAWAQRIDSRLDATLELYDPTGSLIQMNRNWDGRDALLDFTAAADGEYVVRIFDFQYSGGNEHFYRLWITDGPYVDSIFPPVAEPGTSQAFTLFGRNLPGGVATEWSTPGGPLEALNVTVELPQRGEDPELIWSSPAGPAEMRFDGMTYQFNSEKGAANPVQIMWAKAPVVLEQEPNSSGDTPQKIEVPCEIAGQFQQPGDVDYYLFNSDKGAGCWFELASQRLGLPTDPVLLIERVAVDKNGNKTYVDPIEVDDDPGLIRLNHFNSSSHDPELVQFTPKEGGEYRLTVRDLYGTSQGSPRLNYRLSIHVEKPDFRLVVLPEYPLDGRNAPNTWTPFLRRGGTIRLDCMIYRRDGFTGEVALAAEGLPEGVTCAGSVIGPGQSSTRLILVAAEAAAVWSGNIKIVGTAKIGDADVVREARSATVVWGGAPAVTRAARQIHLSVGEIAPLGMTAGLDRVELVQGSQLHIPIQVARREGFAGKFTITGDQLPDKVANESVEVPENGTETTLHLFVPNDAPTGTFTLFAQGAAQVPSPRKDKDGKPVMVNVVEASTPVTVTIGAGPVTLEPGVPGNGVVKRGGEIKIPVKINRRNGFEGPVTLGLKLPAGISGVTAAELSVAADQTAGDLVVKTTAEATVGNHPHVAISAKSKFNEKEVEVHHPIPLNVQE